MAKAISTAVNISTFGLIKKKSVSGFFDNILGKTKETFGGGPTPLPQAPSAAEAQAKSDDLIRKKRAAASQSVYTSPLGVSGQADIAKKTLLGQ